MHIRHAPRGGRECRPGEEFAGHDTALWCKEPEPHPKPWRCTRPIGHRGVHIQHVNAGRDNFGQERFKVLAEWLDVDPEGEW